MTKKFAFTLAEVLIALAIIGVVAAMTIPTFMANTAGAQFKTGLKKTISVLTQAAAANYATEGYDFGTANSVLGTETEGVVTPTATHSDANALPPTDSVIGFDTVTITDPGDGISSDLARDPSLFHLFQNNLNLKNSNELQNYAVAGTPVELSCAGRDAATGVAHQLEDGTDGSEYSSTINQTDARVGATDAAGTARAKMFAGGMRSLCDPVAVSAGGINQGRMFQMEDGAVFTYDAAQAYCTETSPCYGYIDVNGPAGPNRMIACSAGDNNVDGWIPSYGKKANEEYPGSLTVTCTVESKDITDIYPVAFYGSSVKPATLAAKAVLYNTKSNQKPTE